MDNSKIDAIIRTRRRTVSLTVTPDARLVIRAPEGLPLSSLEDFVRQKEKWIRRTRALMLERQARFAAKRFVPGETFLLLGDRYRFEIVEGISGIRIEGDRLLFPAAFTADPRKKTADWYRAEARRVLQERVSHYSSLTGIPYASIRISGARSNWGSCGLKGTLNFTWRLVQAPMPVIDYIVVHELVHVQVRDHSKYYWARVSAILPDHKSRRRWLNENQQLLFAI